MAINPQAAKREAKASVAKDSEFRAYPFIVKSLDDLGWDTRNPLRYASGQVYTQHEALRDKILQPLLQGGVPENVVKVDEGIYWVIEAKAEHKDLTRALQEAQDYAEKINEGRDVACLFATGVAGHDGATYYVETYYYDGKKWRRVQINGIDTTGFISRDQALEVVHKGDPDLKDQEIPEEVFFEKANAINQILHEGAINKRNRARVIASLLLALVNDEYMRISDDPTTLIQDINARVESLLRTYGKENFAQEIELALPASRDNHKKNRRALVDCIQELRSMNIKSAINSGSDLLGQFYEIFLKYANDSKEIGIVLTPRHITQFAAEVVNVTASDFVLDVTTGTGGFLVAALDRIKRTAPKQADAFGRSHIYGIEQDAEVVGLALVNMIFRKDGNSNIYEGNTFENFFFKSGSEYKHLKLDEYKAAKEKGQSLERFITKTLMNPPFALSDPEYQFVDHALGQMADGGLLFAVVPSSTMSSTSDGRGEITWRENMLKRHTLKAVIKLSEDLFLPNAHKGTYAVIIEAWRPHEDAEVFWAIMDDGFTMKKAKRMPSHNVPSNMHQISEELKAFLLLDKAPQEIKKVIGYKKIDLSDPLIDCGAEAYIDHDIDKNIDMVTPTAGLFSVLLHQRKTSSLDLQAGSYKLFTLEDLTDSIARGDCPPLNGLSEGDTPIITTTEVDNGVSGYFNAGDATIFEDMITIPANGSKYKAFYHPYEFAAVPDVLVCKLKPEFNSWEAQVFICSVINQSSWRFSYFRKCNEQKIAKDVRIALPMKNDKLDIEEVRKALGAVPTFSGLKAILSER